MAATAGTLIHLLLILFAFDIIRKFFFKPKDINNNSNSLKNKNKYKYKNNKTSITDLSRNKNINEEDDDEFVTNKNIEKINEEKNEEINDNKNGKKKKILIIKYDKYFYQKNFMDLKYEIENNYTNVFVEGEEYPVPENRKIFSKFTYITQIGVTLLLIFTKYLKLGLPFLSDNTIKIIEDYKWLIIIGNFLVHFWLNKYLVTTGAFEIIYKDKLVYSKLETHIFPKKKELLKVIKSLHLKIRNEEDF